MPCPLEDQKVDPSQKFSSPLEIEKAIPLSRFAVSGGVVSGRLLPSFPLHYSPKKASTHSSSMDEVNAALLGERSSRPQVPFLVNCISTKKPPPSQSFDQWVFIVPDSQIKIMRGILDNTYLKDPSFPQDSEVDLSRCK